MACFGGGCLLISFYGPYYAPTPLLRLRRQNALPVRIRATQKETNASFTAFADEICLKFPTWKKRKNAELFASSFAPPTLASRSGHLDILKWAREKGCPWDHMTCRAAAEGGHSEVLQWARQNGCPWDSSTTRAAAREGHLSLLQWARANDCPWDDAVSV